MEKLEPCTLLIGIQNGADSVQNSKAIAQKTKTELYNPAISLLVIYPRKVKGRTGTESCILMFKAALFTIAQRWN